MTNTESILARVYSALACAEAGTAVAAELSGLRDALEQQLRAETASSRGTLSALKTVQRMLAYCRSEHRTALAYAWTDGQGRQCACDGFRAYRLAAGHHLDLEPRPDDAGKPVDLDRVFPDTASGRYIDAAVPAVAALRACIATHRARWAGVPARKRPDCTWQFPETGMIVNAQFLLDALTVLPGARILLPLFTIVGAPLVLRSDAGDGLLLPIRPLDEQGEVYAGMRRAADQRLKGYPLPELPEGATPAAYAAETLRGSSSEALDPDTFAACLDLMILASPERRAS